MAISFAELLETPVYKIPLYLLKRGLAGTTWKSQTI